LLYEETERVLMLMGESNVRATAYVPDHVVAEKWFRRAGLGVHFSPLSTLGADGPGVESSIRLTQSTVCTPGALPVVLVMETGSLSVFQRVLGETNNLDLFHGAMTHPLVERGWEFSDDSDEELAFY
jgi:hypothetical protein